MKRFFGSLLLGIIIGLSVEAARAYADPNVALTYNHQESFVKVSTFTGCSSVTLACSVATLAYDHRSFAVTNTTNVDLALVIVPSSTALSGSSFAPIYIQSGWTRVVDNGSDQVILPAGSKLYVYYVGSAPGSGSFILDQLF